LPAHDRLAYQGLWCLADRAGRLKDEPLRLRARIFPYEPEVDMDATLRRLSTHWVTRYVGPDGRRYLEVRNLSRHQHFHLREPASHLPGPPEEAQCQPGAGPVLAPVEHDPDPADTDTDTDPDTDTDTEGKKAAQPAAPTPVQAFVDLWHNETLPPIGRCRELTKARRTAIKARLRDRPLEEWRLVFRRINASAFCRGDNDRGWRACIDWVLRPDTAAKVLEGTYDSRAARGPANRAPVNGSGDWCHDHDPPCKTQQEHIRRTLEAARVAREEAHA